MSCTSFLKESTWTSRSPIKLSKVREESFAKTCIICRQNHGACVKCSKEGCMIYMHPECARRAGYYLDIGRNIQDCDEDEIEKESPNKIRQRLSTFGERRIFCEPHRPFKIVQKIRDKRNQKLEELKEFYVSVAKRLETNKKMPFKI